MAEVDRIPPAVVEAVALAWIGTPSAPRQALRGHGADCVGLVRGVAWELTGRRVDVPGWSEDWTRLGDGAAILGAADRHLARISRSAARPGDVLSFRVGAARAAHVGILTSRGLVHVADYAGRVTCDTWHMLRRPTGAWAIRPHPSAGLAPIDLLPSDCCAVIVPHPCGSATVDVAAPDGALVARSGAYSSHSLAVDAAAAVFDHVETVR